MGAKKFLQNQQNEQLARLVALAQTALSESEVTMKTTTDMVVLATLMERVRWAKIILNK